MSGSGYEPRRIVFYDGEEVQIVIRERNSWRDQCEDLMGQVEQLTRHHGVLSDSLDEVGSERDILKQENDSLKNEIETMNLAYEKLNRELVRTRENVVTAENALGRQTVSSPNLVRDVQPTVAEPSGSEADTNGKRKSDDQGRNQRPKRKVSSRSQLPNVAEGESRDDGDAN